MAKRSSTRATKHARARPQSPAEDASEDYVSDGDNEESDDTVSLHSDALDEEEPTDLEETETQKKRRRVASLTKRVQRAKHEQQRTPPKFKRGGSEKKTPAKKKRKVVEDAVEDELESDVELKDGQEVVGKVVEAPTAGWAPEGQISQHTLDFLMQLRDPACNDRVWFKLHEPVYRRCEKEFKSFVEAFTTMLTEVDPQIPPLPPKDVVHRIYRDIRFSNDKTPYKTGLSASFSRSGRKGIFAFCVVFVDVLLNLSSCEIRSIKPGDESLIAAGAWCPGKNELNLIRNHIKRSSDRLRQIISEPEFVAHFGEPRPHPQGKRQNVFGAEDELKTAPKGVDRHHEDIDLLKCRSFTVSRRFSDEEVLAGTFIQELEKVAQILRPFVHCLNDMMTLPVERDSSDDESQG